MISENEKDAMMLWFHYCNWEGWPNGLPTWHELGPINQDQWRYIAKHIREYMFKDDGK